MLLLSTPKVSTLDKLCSPVICNLKYISQHKSNVLLKNQGATTLDFLNSNYGISIFRMLKVLSSNSVTRKFCEVQCSDNFSNFILTINSLRRQHSVFVK